VSGFFYLRSTDGPQATVEGTGMTVRQLQDTYDQLCRTRALAVSQVPAARELFFSQVHSPLHLIAQAAQNVDRSVAARMLEAKNDVESVFNSAMSPDDAGAALDRLLPSTAEALRSVGVTTSGCDIPRQA